MKTYPLKAERKRRGWSQAKIAAALGVSTRTVSRWELGLTAPYPYYREQLCALFGKDARELGLLSDIDEHDMREDTSLVRPTVSDIPGALSSVDSLLGRQDVFMQIKERLFAGNHVALTALGDLPGIGKTALAAALASDREVQTHFRDGVLWAGLGPHPNMLSLLARWGKLLGVAPNQVENVNSRESWGQVLRDAIGTRRLLLIIDDAWTAEDALALQVGGPACTYLLTTRQSQVASGFAQEGTIVIPQLEEADGQALSPQMVQQDTEGTCVLVQALGGLPLALTLMGKYPAASQSSTEQPWPLRTAVVRFYDTEGRLLMSMPTGTGEGSSSVAESMPPYPQTIAISDQQLSPQAHTALHALSVFLPKPNSFSEEASLVASQQPVEALDELWDTKLLENWGPERYVLHQAIADHAHAQGKVPAAQKRRVSSLLEKDVQVREPNTHMPGSSHFPHSSLQDLRLQMSSVLTFRSFKRFSSHPWLILSTILLIVLVIIAVLPTFNMLLPHKSAHQEDNYDYAPPVYMLRILSTDPSMQANAQHLQRAFKAVYTQLVNRFALDPSTAPKDMTLTRSSSLSSQVSISGRTISVSSDWLQSLPSNIGLLTHELALFVEEYPSKTPAWFSDGMADYARSVYGPADDDDWLLPNGVQPTDSYMQGGKVAARFLLWLEQHTRLDIVDQLNHALQTRQSFSAVFHRLTHQTVDELWSQYQKDPDITLTPGQLYKTVTSRKPIYQSSSLSVQASQPITMGLEGLEGVSVSNFAIQADMTILSGDGGGFAFRWNTDAQYHFQMASDGTFDLVNQTNIGPSGFSPAIRQGLNQANRVAIIAQKHTIYVYVNGQLIIEVDGNSTYVNGQPADKMNESSSSYGRVALMANESNDPTKVRFENVQVF